MEPINKHFTESEVNPLSSLDQWEEDVLERYPDPESIATAKSTTEYRKRFCKGILPVESYLPDI